MPDKNTEADSLVLSEIGGRLAALRLQKNLKQEDVAREAGIGLRTLQRLESGEAASRLSSLVRVMRVLGISGNLDRLVPAPTISPMTLLKQEKQRPQRASRAKPPEKRDGDWNWNE